MLRWFTWIRSVTQILDWLQILAYHLVQSVGHEAVKASLLRLQVIRSELLDEHASWGHSDLTVGEKRGSVWSDNGHFTCGQRWHYAVHMARTSAVVCGVGVRFAAHTTLGLRLLCRSGMIVWVRMYTPEKEGENWHASLWWGLTAGRQHLNCCSPTTVGRRWIKHVSLWLPLFKLLNEGLTHGVGGKVLLQPLCV